MAKEINEKIINFSDYKPETSGNISIGNLNSGQSLESAETAITKTPQARVYRQRDVGESRFIKRDRRQELPGGSISNVQERRGGGNEQPPRPPEAEIELPPFDQDPIDWYFVKVDQAKSNRDNLEIQQDKIRNLIQNTTDESLRNRYSSLLSGSKSEEGAKKLTDAMFLHDLESARNTLQIHANRFSTANRTKADYVWQIIAPVVEYQEIYQANLESKRKEFEEKGEDIERIKEASDLFKNVTISQKGLGEFKPGDLIVAENLKGKTLAINEVDLPNPDAVSVLNGFQDTSVSSRQRINQLYNWYQGEFALSDQIKSKYDTNLNVSPEHVIRYKLDQSVDNYFHNAMDFFERTWRVFNDTEREEYEQFLKNLREGLDGKFRARRWFQLHYLDYQGLRGGALAEMGKTQHTSGIPETIIGIVKGTPGFQEVYNLYDQQTKIRWLESEQRSLRIALGEINDPSGNEQTRVARLRGKSPEQAQKVLVELTAEINTCKSEVDEMIEEAASALADDDVGFDDVKRFSEKYSGVEGFETEYSEKLFVQTSNAFRLVKRFREVTGEDAQLRKFAEVRWERGEEKVGYNFVKIFDLEGWLIKEAYPETEMVVGTDLVKIPLKNFWEYRQIPLVISSAFDRTFEGSNRSQRRRLKDGINPSDFGLLEYLPEYYDTFDASGNRAKTPTFPTDIEARTDLTEEQKDIEIENRITQMVQAMVAGRRGDKDKGINIDTAHITWSKIDLSKMSDEDNYEGWWIDVGKADKLRKSIGNFLAEGDFFITGEKAAIDQIKKDARDFDEIWGPIFARKWARLTTGYSRSTISSTRRQARNQTQEAPISLPMEELAVQQIMGLIQRGSADNVAVFENEHYNTYLSCIKNPDGTDKWQAFHEFQGINPTVKDGAIMIANLLGGGAYRPKVEVKTDTTTGARRLVRVFDSQGRLERDYIVGDYENGGQKLIEAYLNRNQDGTWKNKKGSADYIRCEEFLAYAGLKYDIDPDTVDRYPHHKRVRFAKNDEKFEEDGTTILGVDAAGNSLGLSDRKKALIEDILKERLTGDRSDPDNKNLYGLPYGWPQLSAKIVNLAAKLHSGITRTSEANLGVKIKNHYQITENLVPQLRQIDDLPESRSTDSPDEIAYIKAARQVLTEKTITEPDVDPLATALRGNWLEWKDMDSEQKMTGRSLPLRLHYDPTLTFLEFYYNWTAEMAKSRGEVHPWKSQPTPADWHEILMNLAEESGGPQIFTKEQRIQIEHQLNCVAENVGYQTVMRRLIGVPDKKGELEGARNIQATVGAIGGFLGPVPRAVFGAMNIAVPKHAWEAVSKFGGAVATGFAVAAPTGQPEAGVAAGILWYLVGGSDHRGFGEGADFTPGGWPRLLFKRWDKARSSTIPGTEIKWGVWDWRYDPAQVTQLLRRKLGVYIIRE